MTVEFARTSVPSATLQRRPDGSAVLTCPLCGTSGKPFVVHFKARDARLAEQCLAVHTIRQESRP